MNLYSLFASTFDILISNAICIKGCFCYIIFYLVFFQADSLKKSLKGSSGNGGGCSLDSKMQQVKELEEEVNK